MQRDEKCLSINIPTYDHLPQILNKRIALYQEQENSKRFGEIFFTDDFSALITALKEIILADTLSIKLGILYRVGGHTTPLMVEKKVIDCFDLILHTISEDGITVDLQAMSELSELHDNKPVLIRKGEVISLYGYSAVEGKWIETLLQSDKFNDLNFPSEGNTTIIKNSELKEEMWNEIVLKNAHTEMENLFIYNTDSTALDIEEGDAIRNELSKLIEAINLYIDEDEQLSKKYNPAKLFCLSFDVNCTEVVANYKRQYDTHSCATFSLLDIEIFLAEDVSCMSSEDYIENTKYAFLFSLKKLPSWLMYSLQSIEGKAEYGVVERKGLKSLVADDPAAATTGIQIFSPIRSVDSLKSNQDLYDVFQALLAIAKEESINLSLIEKIKLFDKEHKDEEKSGDQLTAYPVSLKQLCSFLAKNDLRRNFIVDLYNQFYYGLFDAKKGSMINADEFDVLSINSQTLELLAAQQSRALEAKQEKEQKAFTTEKILIITIGLLVLTLVKEQIKCKKRAGKNKEQWRSAEQSFSEDSDELSDDVPEQMEEETLESEVGNRYRLFTEPPKKRTSNQLILADKIANVFPLKHDK